MTASKQGHSAKAWSPILVSLADVKPETVSWLWTARLAKGKLNLLVGDPGTGKTFAALDMAARLSRSVDWPDGERAPLTSSLILTAEDGLADTIRPRLDLLGADVTRVTALEALRSDNQESGFTFEEEHLPALEKALTDTQAGLMIVDPLSAYFGKTDTHVDSKVRGILGPLARLAEQEGVAVLGIVHITKAEDRRLVARVQGSMAFVAAARVVLAVTRDPKDGDRRFLASLKGNLAAPAPTLAYRLGETGLVWEPQPVMGIDVESIVAGAKAPDLDEHPTKIDEAKAFFREVLSQGGLHQEEVKGLAIERGIRDRTFWRAKKELGIQVERLGDFGDRSAWRWYLPGWELPAAAASYAAPEEGAEEEDLAVLDDDGGIGAPSIDQDCQADQSCQPCHPAVQ